MDRLAKAVSRQQRRLWLLAVFFVGAVCLSWFFRPVIVSNFRFLPGDLGDTRFCNAILEHWWTFWRAGRDWKSPPMFFPEPGVLAYSDALFLFSPFYGLARASGLTPYYALAAMVAGLLFFGYLSTAWLLRHDGTSFALRVRDDDQLVSRIRNVPTKRRAGRGPSPRDTPSRRSVVGTRWGHEIRGNRLRQSPEATVPWGGSPPRPAPRVRGLPIRHTRAAR